MLFIYRTDVVATPLTVIRECRTLSLLHGPTSEVHHHIPHHRHLDVILEGRVI